MLIRDFRFGVLAGYILAAALLAGNIAAAQVQSDSAQPQWMPSGQFITPLAPAGAKFSQLNAGLKDFPDYTVGQGVKTAISANGNTLPVLTSGFNR